MAKWVRPDFGHITAVVHSMWMFGQEDSWEVKSWEDWWPGPGSKSLSWLWTSPSGSQVMVFELSCQMVRSREVQSLSAQTRLRHQYEADETASSCRTPGNRDSTAHGQDPWEEFAKAFSCGFTAVTVSPSLCLYWTGRLRLVCWVFFKVWHLSSLIPI